MPIRYNINVSSTEMIDILTQNPQQKNNQHDCMVNIFSSLHDNHTTHFFYHQNSKQDSPMTTYSVTLTTKALQKLSTLGTEANSLTLSSFAVGDGCGIPYTPSPQQEQLRNEKWRGPINTIINENTTMVLNMIVPINTGGFFIREIAIIDEDNELFAIARYPETYKTSPDEGASRELSITISFVFSSNYPITITHDSCLLASYDYVNDKIDTLAQQITTYDNQHQPLSIATQTETLAGVDNTMAVSPKNLKAALDHLKAEITGKPLTQSCDHTNMLEKTSP